MVKNNLEIEIKKWDKGYSFSSEENGKKRIYTICSPELRQKIRKIISPYGIVGKGNIQYSGKNSDGDRILYQQGKDGLPDKLILISREIEDKKELKELDEWDKLDAEFREIKDGLKKSETEWKKIEEKWKKQETEVGVSTNCTEKHTWCSWNDEGLIDKKVMYCGNKPQLIEVEDKGINFSKIQGIADEKSKEVRENENQQELESNIFNSSVPDGSSKKDDNNLRNTALISGAVVLASLVIYFLVKPKKNKEG